MTTFDRLSSQLHAARIAQATNPQQRRAAVLEVYERFCREVTAEAGVDVLADIVKQIRQHADLTRGRAA